MNETSHVGDATGPSDRVTLGAFINLYKVPIELEGIPDTLLCFATPKTLFCTGCYIDEIYQIYEIPSVGNNDPLGDLVDFMNLICTEAGVRRGDLAVPEIQDRMEGNYSDEDSDSDDGSPTGILLEILLRMLCLSRDGEVSLGDDNDTDSFFKSRNSIVAGKPVIITNNGFVGICATPVLLGDYLCWVYSAHSYLILRLIEGQLGDPDAVQKHRIVSRVLLSESLADTSMVGMTEMIESLPMRQFQIV